MKGSPLGAAAPPPPETMPPAVGARLKRAPDGTFVCGPLRVRPRRPSNASRRREPQLPADEMERREHVRR